LLPEWEKGASILPRRQRYLFRALAVSFKNAGAEKNSANGTSIAERLDGTKFEQTES